MFRYGSFKNIGYNNSETPAVYSYETTEDTIAQVSVSGYFSDPRAEIREGDLIVARCTDGSTTLTALNSDSVVAMPAAADVASSTIKSNNALSGQVLVTCLGDSITESKTTYLSWFIRATKGQLIFYQNAGIGGNTSAQMLARINTDVPDETNICTVMAGTNDQPAGITIAQHIVNMTAIFNNLIGRGITPICIAPPPNDDITRSMLVRQYALAQYVLCRNLGIQYFNPWVDYVNPATGAWVSGASLDGTHPKPETEYNVGLILKDLWSNKNYNIPTGWAQGTNDCINTNETLTIVSTTAGVPDRFAKGGTTVSSLSDTSLSNGKTCTLSSNTNSTAMSIQSSAFTLPVGNRILFTCKMDATLVSGDVLRAYLKYDDGIFRPIIDDMTFTFDGLTLTTEFIMPVGKVSTRFVIDSNSLAFGGTVRFAEPQWFDLTAIEAW